MSKERLEEIKEKYSKANVIEHLNGIDIIAAAKRDIQWLIQQSELMQHFTRKNTELNVFLNKYSEPKHFGENVIDVAMDIIGKQAERVQELEEELVKYRNSFELQLLINNSIKNQNKRYREAIRECIERMNEGGAGTRSFVYERLIEVLEGEK